MSGLTLAEQRALVTQLAETCHAFKTTITEVNATHVRFYRELQPLLARFPLCPADESIDRKRTSDAPNGHPHSPNEQDLPKILPVNVVKSTPSLAVTASVPVMKPIPTRPATEKPHPMPSAPSDDRDSQLSPDAQIKLQALQLENARLREEQATRESHFKEMAQTMRDTFDTAARRAEARMEAHAAKHHSDAQEHRRQLQNQAQEHAHQIQLLKAELKAAQTAPRTAHEIGDAGETDVMAYLKRTVGQIFAVEHVGRTPNELDIRITDPPHNTFDIRVEVKNREYPLKLEEMDTFHRNVETVARSSPKFAAAILFQKTRVANAPEGTFLARIHNNNRIYEVGRWALDKLYSVIFDIIAERRSLTKIQEAITAAQTNQSGALACRTSIALNQKLVRLFNAIRGAIADEQSIVTATIRDLVGLLHSAEHERPGFVGNVTITELELDTPKPGKGRPPKRLQRIDLLQADDKDQPDVPMLTAPTPPPAKTNHRKRQSGTASAHPQKRAKRDDDGKQTCMPPTHTAPIITLPDTPLSQLAPQTTTVANVRTPPHATAHAAQRK